MIMLKTFAMKATEEFDQDQLDNKEADLEIAKIAKSFYTVEVLATFIRHVIMDYLVLSEGDIEMWTTDPEGNYTDAVFTGPGGTFEIGGCRNSSFSFFRIK